MARTREPERIRIGELTRRTGVSRATIQHWLAEGLLPRPKKTGQTMAWYDVATVERVRLVKELQRRHLPLHVIREMLGSRGTRKRPPRMVELARHNAELESLLAPDERPLKREEVTDETGISPTDVARLEKMGVVRPRRGGAEFGPCDVAVLRAIGKLGAAGLDSSRGFSVGDLQLYRDAMQTLIAKEVALFARAPVSRDDFVRLAHAAAVGASELVAALHRKLVTELVVARGARRR